MNVVLLQMSGWVSKDGAAVFWHGLSWVLHPLIMGSTPSYSYSNDFLAVAG